MRRGTAIVAASIALCMGGCSSSSGLNLDSNMQLTSLSAGDQAKLCDWEAQQYGGYGKTVMCGGLVAAQRGPTDQASCVSDLPPAPTAMYCQVTVGQFEDCVRWRVQNGCGTTGMPPTDCTALRSPNCSLADAGGD
jgi:hypothetical protein